MKRIRIGKDEVKFSIFPDDTKESVKKKLLKLIIHNFSKVAEYKNNIQKYTVFVYTNNEQCENNIKKQFHL